MNHLPVLEQRIQMRESDRIAHQVSRRPYPTPRWMRLHRHWRIYRRDYLLIGALIVFYALFIYFTPINP